MNIIYLGAFRLPNYDAAAPRVLNNARALRMLGNKITFISWGGKYRQENLCNDGKYRVDGFEYIISGDLPIGGSLKERLTTKFLRGKKSFKILKSLPKPDLIIIYNADNALSKMMIRYCKENDIKLANDMNEWYANNELHLTDFLPNYINMTRTQHRVANKIVISSFLNNYYHDSNNILVPPLCDPNEEKWAASIEDERIKPFNGITLIYAGTPARKDCVDTVINAVNALANEGESIRFLILGTTREAYLQQNSQNLKSQILHENIVFLGRVSQDLIPAYYKKADFMVLLREPTRKSMAGFPTKFTESITAGVPVITNATSDLMKYVINGKTGFLVEGYDYDSIMFTLKNSVLTLRHNDIEEMKNYVKISSSSFDWHSYVDKFKMFLENLK